MYQRTLSIIKPDAVKRNIANEINEYISKAGLVVVAKKKIALTESVISIFYQMHKDRPFFKDLVSYMTSGDVIVQVLEGDNALTKYRKLMGETDPKKADKGTIRGDFAESIDENCVHGSDSAESAAIEIPFFFAEYELIA